VLKNPRQMQGMITVQGIVDAPIINTFGLPEATAPPSEQIFVLSASQLQAIVSQAIERATAPLESRLEELERGGEAPQDGQKGPDQILQVVLDLKASLESLEDMTARERAYDRQRLARLERVDPQPLQKDRGEILRALIAANGGKMLATDARKKMHLSRSRFSKLLATVKDEIEARPYHLNKSWQVLVLR